MTTLAETLWAELGALLEPLVSAAGSDDRRALLLAIVGHTAQTASDPGLAAAIDDLGTLATQISALGDASIASWSGLNRVLTASSGVMNALHNLEASVHDPTLGTQLEGLGQELAGQLFGVYLRRFHARLFRLAALLTLVDPLERNDPAVPVSDGTALTRSAWTKDEFHLDRVGPLVHRPWATLSEAYFPNALAAAADAYASAQLLFPLIGDVAAKVGLMTLNDQKPLVPAASGDPTADPGDGDHFASGPEVPPEELPQPEPPGDMTAFYESIYPRMILVVPQLSGAASGGAAYLGVEVIVSSAQHPAGIRGLVFTLAAAFNWTATYGRWKLTASSQGDVPAFVVGPGGLVIAPSDSPLLEAGATLAIERVATAAGLPAFVLGSDSGTRIEIGALRIDGTLDVSPTAQSAVVKLKASSGKLVIAPEDGDGFLQDVLPSGGFSVDFDLGVIVSSSDGIALEGGVGLAAVLPVDVSLGSIGRVHAITVGLAGVASGFQASVVADLDLTLGPIAGSIDKVGIGATVTFPQTGGNLGPANLAVGFSGPKGMGLSIDAAAITGGGYLSFDPQQGEYAGALDLTICGEAVKAYGLVQTRLPGGGPGYSFLAILSTEFSPAVQLPFGFSLDGVGGLIGVNRTIAEDAVRVALWAHHLDGLLFPTNPVAAAAQLISAVQTYFPAAHGRYVFGPLAKIGWSADIVVGEVALLVELPEPVKLLLIGDVSVSVPSDSPQLALHISFDGGIDFGKKLAFFDATLHDSWLASYPLSGDLALRYAWGDDATFALALGGFNPQFQPPAAFPTLKRLAISISSSVARIEAQSYLALTSNTLQFGARVELTAGTGTFNVHGWLGFDALCERHPFSFEFDLTAGVDLRDGTDVLASVHLDGNLSGPSPWHLSGEASLSLLFFDVSVHFDKTWGSDAGQVSVPDPMPTLIAAFADRSSWSGLVAPGVNAAISPVGTPSDAGGAVLIDPASALRIAQRAIPLDQPITRFGGTSLGRTVSFSVDSITVFGNPIAASKTTTEEFAPAQFLDLTDAEKLSLPSFSRFDAGVVVGADAVDLGESARTRAVVTPITYITTTIDSRPTHPPKTTYIPTVAAVLGLNSSAAGPTPGLSRYRPVPGTPPRVMLASDRWIVAGTSDLAARADISSDGSKLGTHLALQHYLATNPAETGTLQIVLTQEAA